MRLSVLSLLRESHGNGGIKVEIAFWIIAVCEVLRVIQNAVQIRNIRKQSGLYENATSEFVKSLKDTDREFVKKLLKEFEEQENKED